MNPYMKKVHLNTWRHQRGQNCRMHTGDPHRDLIFYIGPGRVPSTKMHRERERACRRMRRVSARHRVYQILGEAIRRRRGA